MAGADLRGLSRAARGHGASGRGPYDARPRIHRGGRRDAAPEARQRAHRADGRVLRAAAARPHQVDRDGGLLHRRRRLHAGDALAAGRGARRRESAGRAVEGVPAPLGDDRRQVRDDEGREGRVPAEAGQDPRRRRRDLRRAVVLRPGAARAPDAAGRPQEARRAVHGVQVRGEHGADGADPRAGRHVCRFDQIVVGRRRRRPDQETMR